MFAEIDAAVAEGREAGLKEGLCEWLGGRWDALVADFHKLVAAGSGLAEARGAEPGTCRRGAHRLSWST